MSSLAVDAKRIDAQFSTELPGTTGVSEPPDEIQWAPPGRHSIQASQGGKPVTLDVMVDEAGAQRVATSFAEHLAKVERNDEDLPYLDFNHDDQEASGHPKRFYWGGTDPQRGGIRAKVEWTSRGREAVIGKTYRRFSPSFYPDDKGNIVGIPVNCGGLVNRAAFKRIAPIMSKTAEDTAVSGSQNFLEKTKVIAQSRNLDLENAALVLAYEHPELYDSYCAELFGRPIPSRRQADAHNEFIDEFVIQGRALEEATEIGLENAYAKLAAEQPALYERYRAKLLGIDLNPEHMMAAHARAEESPFFVRAKAVAREQGMDLSKAFDYVALHEPLLYDSFRSNL